MPKDSIDPLRILVRGIQLASFTNKEMGESVRTLAEVLEKDLDIVNYEPEESVTIAAKELAAMIVSDVTGDQLSLTVVKGKRVEVVESDDDEDIGTRKGFRSIEDDNDDDEDTNT